MSIRSLARPLDGLRSIKVKLGVTILGSVAATSASIFYGWRVTSLRLELRILLTALVFLVVTQVLAHGMTAPLRQMAAAARDLAGGRWDTPVHTAGRDEVGELARAFTSMAHQLAQVDVQRRELLANVGHELRTPLAALQARLENLIDGVEPVDAEALGAMLRSVERLGRLVGQLLDLSRLEAGTLAVERRPFALAGVAADAAEEVLAARAGADVHVDVGVPARLRIDGDPERVHQVLVNLLDNAVRHAPPGSTVHVRADVARPGDRLAAVSVSDAGPGIPPEQVDLVFERFARLDPARSSGAGGAGLGLAIARSLVELHGGRLRAGPAPGGGCRMELTLPVAPPSP